MQLTKSVIVISSIFSHRINLREHMKIVNRDEDGAYSLKLSQAEIISLVSGYIPYIVCEIDPEIPEGEFLWIHYAPAENDIIPPFIDPFPCRILSYGGFANLLHILTLSPIEFNLDFMELVEEFRDNMKKSDKSVRFTL